MNPSVHKAIGCENGGYAPDTGDRIEMGRIDRIRESKALARLLLWMKTA